MIGKSLFLFKRGVPKLFVSLCAAGLVWTCGADSDLPIGTLEEGVYTVSIPAGEVNRLTAADVTAMGDATALVKRGEGTLASTLALTDFNGEIRIEQGAFLVGANGHLGTGEGATSVSNGATLVIWGGSGKPDCLDAVESDPFRYKPYIEPYFLSGEGTPDERGAVVSKGSGTMYYALQNVTLLGDTTFRISPRVDFSRAGTLTMNGHTLTFYGGQGGLCRAKIKAPGHIIVAAGEFVVEGRQDNIDWEGDASNTVTVRDGGRFSRLLSSAMIPWRLVVEKGGRYYAGSYNNQAQLIMTDVLNRWNGPAELGDVIESVNGTNAVCVFNGPVSGVGGFNASRGWLVLNGTNTYEGPTKLDATKYKIPHLGAGIRLKQAKAYPEDNTNGIELIDADLVLDTDDCWRFPVIRMNGAGGVSNVVRGTQRGTVSSLVKTGAGTLDLQPPFNVGSARIEGGTLRLPSVNDLPLGRPGMMLGYLPNSTLRATNATGLVYNQYCPDGPGPLISRSWWAPETGKNEAWYCHGWLWNRGTEPVKWDLALKACNRSDVWLNGVKVFDYVAMTWTRTTVELQPGPNELYIATMKWSSSSFGGPVDLSYAAAIRYDPDCHSGSEPCTATNVQYTVENHDWYRDLIDPGDGSLLTVDPTPSEDFDRFLYLPSFDDLAFADGTSFDLNGNVFTVGAFSGCPALLNAPRFSMTNTWRIAASSLLSGARLHTAGPVVFGADARVAIADADILPRTGDLVLCEALGGVTGLPKLSEPLYEADWRIQVSSDKTRVELISRRGLILLFK